MHFTKIVVSTVVVLLAGGLGDQAAGAERLAAEVILREADKVADEQVEGDKLAISKAKTGL